MGEIGVLGSMLLLCRRRSSGMLSCALATIRAPATYHHASTSQVRKKAMPSNINHVNQHSEDEFANNTRYFPCRLQIFASEQTCKYRGGVNPSM